MNKVLILSGISGSGKSSYGASLGNSCVVSTDHFFLDSSAQYRFDPFLLTQAHAECFREFIDALQSEIHTLMAYSEKEVQMCADRNRHKVPYRSVLTQHQRLIRRQLKPWWNSTFLNVSV